MFLFRFRINRNFIFYRCVLNTQDKLVHNFWMYFCATKYLPISVYHPSCYHPPTELQEGSVSVVSVHHSVGAGGRRVCDNYSWCIGPYHTMSPPALLPPPPDIFKLVPHCTGIPPACSYLFFMKRVRLASYWNAFLFIMILTKSILFAIAIFFLLCVTVHENQHL